jgi:hypothetical protein
VLGKRLSGRCDAFRCEVVLSGIGLEFFELQFHLVDQPGAPFRTLAILLAAHLGDLELEVPNHRLGGRHDGAPAQDRPRQRRHALPMLQARHAVWLSPKQRHPWPKAIMQRAESPTKTVE